MARRRVEVRREEILDAAAAEVVRRGFAQTRVADIAAELGISPGLVFYHFGNKEQLFAEAFKHALERDAELLDKTVAAASDPADAISRILSISSPRASAPTWTAWVDAWAESLREPAMRNIMAKLDSRWKKVLADQIELGTTQGIFSCADPRRSAVRIAGFLDGMAVQLLVHRSLTHSEFREWVIDVAARELGIEPARIS